MKVYSITQTGYVDGQWDRLVSIRANTMRKLHFLFYIFDINIHCTCRIANVSV